MSDLSVRITEITLKNFKNVGYGHLDLRKKQKKYQASVLGVYGQNGSGKTALIDAIELLQAMLCGKSASKQAADFIMYGANHAELSFGFAVCSESERYHVYYDLKLRKTIAEPEQNTGMAEDLLAKPMIYEESIRYSYEGKFGKMRMSVLADTSSARVFSPVGKYTCLIGDDKDRMLDMMVAKKLAQDSARSFLFSRELIKAAREHAYVEKSAEYVRHMALLERLIRFGNYELFVINTARYGMVNLNMLPLAFRYRTDHVGMVGSIAIPLENPSLIPEDVVSVVEKVVGNMNIALREIIPGLTVAVKDWGADTLKDGKPGRRIQFMSQKPDGTEIPLRYESEGVKKIISVLQLLIAAYNEPSVTVAIDELDAGIFEYLLGELLRIISEKGKGQLLFTSHNLRPLETIDKSFIALTTTNPENRYTWMANVKGNNNARDVYYRDIVLGEQQEEVYQPTNNAEIALAFREAGT